MQFVTVTDMVDSSIHYKIRGGILESSVRTLDSGLGNARLRTEMPRIREEVAKVHMYWNPV